MHILYTYRRTYIRTYIHTYIHTYIQTCIHTYITCIHIDTCSNTDKHTDILSDIQTHISTGIHIRITSAPYGVLCPPPVLGADVLSPGAAVLRKASAPKTGGRTLYPGGGGRDTEGVRPQNRGADMIRKTAAPWDKTSAPQIFMYTPLTFPCRPGRPRRTRAPQS